MHQATCGGRGGGGFLAVELQAAPGDVDLHSLSNAPPIRLSLNGQAPLARHRHALLQLDQPAADAGFDARTLEARPRAVEVCVARNDRRPGQRPLRRQAQEADGAALPPPPPHPILHAAHGRFAAPSTSTRASTIAPSVAATNRHTAEGPSPLQVRHTKAQRIGGEEALSLPESTRAHPRVIENHREPSRLPETRRSRCPTPTSRRPGSPCPPTSAYCTGSTAAPTAPPPGPTPAATRTAR